ncbi:hypothetical protein [Bacteroides caccae]|uniref:hypothetical protein n=1 Tax=Bacteroides caccae TaxID=47678 RepID=UPI00356A4820
MNKKFLSAVLFGALLASTTGTFTSCKDYDDDINGLSERVDAIEKTLADLNTKFGSLAYVKSVSFAGGELVVTDQDGKPERFSIPDKNTTYSLEINQSTEGDATTVTVILKDGDGKVVSSKSFTLTDKDTITDTLDPSLFWMDESGVIWYGLKTDKDNCIKTGVTVPLHDKTSVAIVETKVGEAGPVVGWDITIDNVTTHLSVLDALSITSFSWIPKDYYNGIEAVAFGSYSYNKVVGTETADTTYTATGDETLSSFPGEANFYINPSSASLAQIKGGAEGATVLYKGTTNHTTRADIGATATLSKTDGILTASIVGDMNQAETDPNALDMLALRMTTTNGQTFTTNYFAVYNQKEEVSFTLVDNCKLEGEAIKDADKLSTQWSNVKEQAAVIDANNVAESGNAHLVQALQYNEAIAGVDLNKYVAVAMTKGDKSEIVNLAAKKLSIEYVLCKYDVEGTDQINYATLEGSTLKAVNYEGVNMSCIGKTPIVKAIVKDTNNGNAVVAVAYIKFLYVGNEWTVSKNYTAPVSETKVLDWDCFEDPAMNYTTTVKYMSTEVYPKVGSELGLNALSKKEFATIYQFVADQADVPTEFKSTNITSITEITGAENNADNRQVKFDIDEDAIKEVNKDGTYTFYGVYKKTDAAAAASSQYRQYPVYVAIPYVVKVQNYPTLANGRIKNVNDYRIAQAWENGFAICKGSKETDNGAALYLDLNEAIDLTAFKTANNAVKYELDIVDPETGAVAMLGNEWCNTHGADLDWIVLKKQLTNEEEVIVPVKVYAVLCNNDKIETGTVNVKFVNPAKVSLSKNIINVKDGTEAYTTEDLKKYITITSSKDSSVELYKDGALTTAGEKILGKSANVSINLAKGSVIPTQWENKFTLNADGTVTWNLEGQNTLAKGQNATCDITFTIEYGKVKPSQVITDCTETSPVLGGGKLTGKFTIKAWNADEFPVE